MDKFTSTLITAYLRGVPLYILCTLTKMTKPELVEKLAAAGIFVDIPLNDYIIARYLRTKIKKYYAVTSNTAEIARLLGIDERAITWCVNYAA